MGIFQSDSTFCMCRNLLIRLDQSILYSAIKLSGATIIDGGVHHLRLDTGAKSDRKSALLGPMGLAYLKALGT